MLAIVAVAGAIAFFRRPPTATDDPLAACPASSFLVAKIDLAALRASPLGELVDQVARGLIPMPRAAAVQCDLAGKLETLALVVPEGEERSELGLAMKARLEGEERRACAEALERGAGGATERRAPFALVPTGDPRADTLAVTENGLALLAPREWALAMVAAATKKAPNATGAPPHGEALRSLGSRHLVVSVALPRATRERIRREMEGTLKPEERRSMEGVLGVEAVAAALDVRAETELAADLRCDTQGACSSVNELIAKKRKAASESMVLRLLGIGRALEGLTVNPAGDGRRLELRMRMATTDLRAAVEQALFAWRQRPAGSSRGPVAPPSSAPPLPGGPDAGP